jgi:hypothetical protein
MRELFCATISFLLIAACTSTKEDATGASSSSQSEAVVTAKALNDCLHAPEYDEPCNTLHRGRTAMFCDTRHEVPGCLYYPVKLRKEKADGRVVCCP